MHISTSTHSNRRGTSSVVHMHSTYLSRWMNRSVGSTGIPRPLLSAHTAATVFYNATSLTDAVVACSEQAGQLGGSSTTSSHDAGHELAPLSSVTARLCLLILLYAYRVGNGRLRSGPAVYPPGKTRKKAGEDEKVENDLRNLRTCSSSSNRNDVSPANSISSTYLSQQQ